MHPHPAPAPCLDVRALPTQRSASPPPCCGALPLKTQLSPRSHSLSLLAIGLMGPRLALASPPSAPVPCPSFSGRLCTSRSCVCLPSARWAYASPRACHGSRPVSYHPHPASLLRRPHPPSAPAGSIEPAVGSVLSAVAKYLTHLIAIHI